MSAVVVPLILAGGQGTRLWPMSRTARPKQFLPLTGPVSPFQHTLERVADARYAPALVITNSEYRFIVGEQAAELGIGLSGILLEPVARNTAMAIAVAAAYIARHFGPETLMHVLPSDQDVTVDQGYWLAVDQAVEAASSGRFVTFGIRPLRVETGFGHIKCDAVIGGLARPVEHFVEKPDKARAAQMLEEGGYFWNSGMFMLHAAHFLAETERLAPDTHRAALASAQAAREDLDFIRLEETAFATAPDISVDYAIFEKTARAAMVAVDFSWTDLGNWNAVWKSGERDALGNVTRGRTTLLDVSNSLIVSDHAHIAVDGLDDVAVIATNDAVFVGRLSQAQRVGDMVKRLRTDTDAATLTEIHPTAHRPWGGYSSILNGDRFQVKRLFVKPGKKLSLQKHHHRAEHWIVVRGTAEVTVDGAITALTENQSIYLPLGCAHRLSNPGKIDLELIEVQTGSYLGEDDIVRIEDEFGRA
ncbi:mannose-1-phosphate guanylyltransferase/mannose-6-phosphate isomerase [Devosia sp. YIM 151766]|uniref:mannose-1-phosphate guanylyltransferase/mannose-6-phosphate isomerase n=1 Tax=Devosia sp. YIM 151766 TaxID=3017325 RepID=UPI00255CBD84|nr:mannose-1-phosphate guanylyltransferase/mannose-6-phosphate isomerase [Devosia sp. YIM 151766]WIY51554.1 mannose-1-phosphate guanylyltransferase/mannose-6-phosphate isomerase [Devosia sp. YIM 151766]